MLIQAKLIKVSNGIFDEQTIHANVKSTDKIIDIKERYFAEVYRQGKNVRLIFQGQELQNDKTVEYYQLRPESVILVAEQMLQQQHSNGYGGSNSQLASFLDDLNGISIYLMVFLCGIWYFGITNPGSFSIIIWFTLILITGAFILFRVYMSLLYNNN